MRVLLSGASGMIGTRLRREFSATGHELAVLVRRLVREDAGEIRWSPDSGTLDRQALEAFAPEVAIHLSGVSIAGLWTPRRKRMILKSRLRSTSTLASALAEMANPPRLLISMSAIGVYGDRGEERLLESSGEGEGYFAEVCKTWEESAESARRAGIRTIHPRTGIVLASEGGMLGALTPLYRFGLGTVFGTGEQGVSWIHVDDLVRAFMHIIESQEISGPVNLVAPETVSQRQFAQTLARHLGRPLWLRVPGWALRMLPGGMGGEMLLTSQWVIPDVLVKQGFSFEYPNLDDAFAALFPKR